MYRPDACETLKDKSIQSLTSCADPGSTTTIRRCSNRTRLSAGTCVESHHGSWPEIMTAPPCGCAPESVPSARASAATCDPTLLKHAIDRQASICEPLTAATLNASLFAWNARTPWSLSSLLMSPRTSKKPATGEPG